MVVEEGSSLPMKWEMAGEEGLEQGWRKLFLVLFGD
jgi:hypothetical protein